MVAPQECRSLTGASADFGPEGSPGGAKSWLSKLEARRAKGPVARWENLALVTLLGVEPNEWNLNPEITAAGDVLNDGYYDGYADFEKLLWMAVG